ncbi:hypothetical protein EON73_00580 [bacterium]|nr:MAG: hypothetical protein EON73_00580 [bacterium]
MLLPKTSCKAYKACTCKNRVFARFVSFVQALQTEGYQSKALDRKTLLPFCKAPELCSDKGFYKYICAYDASLLKLK